VAAATALVGEGMEAVLIKGGHLHRGVPDGAVIDTLMVGADVERLQHARAAGGDVRGTGCALATAIAVHLGRGASMLRAVEDASAWLARAIAGAVDVEGERHLGPGDP
jgi:hydroxymethylpyrimidine/phosphomethylpyrimidine kinase